MSLQSAARRLTAISAMLTFGLARQDVWGQRRDTAAHVPIALQGLERLGELRLKPYSIHGYAPLVLLFTEAPASAPEAERRYRHLVTTTLLQSLERRPFSVFSLNPKHQLMLDASAVFDVFRGQRAIYQPQAVIGFADGAVAAARLLGRDSSPAALVALVPSAQGDTASAAREALEEDLRRVTEQQSRAVLVLESPCNGLLPERWLAEYGYRWGQTVLILPQYDGWLARRTGSACSPGPGEVATMGIDLVPIVVEWLGRTVSYPQ